MRVPAGLHDHHVADAEWLRDQMISYNAEDIFAKLWWERTDTEDGWRLTGPWKPTPVGYQRIGLVADKYARLREVCGVVRGVLLHRLVSAMMQPTPHGDVGNVMDKPTVHHLDDDKLNCAPSNLVIITGRENVNESRVYGAGFCDQHGHPIVGKNIKRNHGRSACRWCDLEGKRFWSYETGRVKQHTPLPSFWLWMMEQYADAPDPELALMHDTGLLVPVIV